MQVQNYLNPYVSTIQSQMQVSGGGTPVSAPAPTGNPPEGQAPPNATPPPQGLEDRLSIGGTARTQGMEAMNPPANAGVPQAEAAAQNRQNRNPGPGSGGLGSNLNLIA